MKKENNLYDEPEQEAPIDDVKEPEVNFYTAKLRLSI